MSWVGIVTGKGPISDDEQGTAGWRPAVIGDGYGPVVL